MWISTILNRDTITNIKRLRWEGNSYKEIAKKLDISPSSSYKYARNVNMSSKGKEKLESKVKKTRENFVKRGTKNIKIPKNITPKLGRFIGHCLFDGSVFKDGYDYKIAYTNSSKKLVKLFIKDIEKLFNIQPTQFLEIKRKSKSYQVQFFSKKLWTYLRKFINNYSTSNENCELNNIIFEQDQEFKKEFLRSFWEDEGCISINRTISGSSKNKKIIEQLKILHLNIGIKTSKWNSKKEYGLLVKIRNKENLLKFYQQICPIHAKVTKGPNKNRLKREIFEEIFKKSLPR
ncbi:MAG: LAGLIDADG family homing endonuclease [Candidatus Aenigmatarchaeota archaeon]